MPTPDPGLVPLHERGAGPPQILQRDQVTTPRWRTIESAPKDGTEILGWGGSGVDVWVFEVQKYHKHPRPFWHRLFHGDAYDRACQPTHWMPLPEPPARRKTR